MTELKWIDTHAHYNHSRFGNNLAQDVLKNMPDYVEKIINVGTNSKNNQETLQLVSLYNYIYGMLGFFPTDTIEICEELNRAAEDNWIVLTKQLTNDRIVGVGEIGLDYNWNRIGDVTGEEAQKLQKKYFRKQLDLAAEIKLPVSIHSRDAYEDTLQIFDSYQQIPGVIHCFSYDTEFAKKALEKGLYFGVGGTSTYPRNKELREAIKYIPVDRILLETDAPYLSPKPVRKQLNNSSYIIYVIENIADIKNITVDEVIEQTNKNAETLFRFPSDICSI